MGTVKWVSHITADVGACKSHRIGPAGRFKILHAVSGCRLTLHEIMAFCKHARLPPITYKHVRMLAGGTRACDPLFTISHASLRRRRREHAAQHQNHTELKSAKDAQ